jgi:(2R)-3-sulfolactate dehydrogenase (NADP+)
MALFLPDALHTFIVTTLSQAGVGDEAAHTTAEALVWADAHGVPTHGVSRLPPYLDLVRLGRVDGLVLPHVLREHGATVLVDALDGFAYPALKLLRQAMLAKVSDTGVVFGAVRHSHHFGAAAYHLHAIGQAGLVGLVLGNSPAALPAWGGKRPLFGTNPIAAVFPRRDAPPLLIDLSLAAVAKGKVAQAAREGRAIPLGWALDKDGQPTTDADAAMQGMLCAMGGVKGTLLALTLELLCAALTGSAFGYEADTFFVAEGNRPRIAQSMLVIDPAALSGQAVYLQRVEDLVEAMLADEGVRLPGDRGRAAASRALVDGIEVPEALLASVQERLALRPAAAGASGQPGQGRQA